MPFVSDRKTYATFTPLTVAPHSATMLQSVYTFCSPICLPLSSLWNKAHLRIHGLLKKEKEDNNTEQVEPETREPSTCEASDRKPDEAKCLKEPSKLNAFAQPFDFRSIYYNSFLEGTQEFTDPCPYPPHMPWWGLDEECGGGVYIFCLLYTSPSPRDQRGSRMPSSA